MQYEREDSNQSKRDKILKIDKKNRVYQGKVTRTVRSRVFLRYIKNNNKDIPSVVPY